MGPAELVLSHTVKLSDGTANATDAHWVPHEDRVVLEFDYSGGNRRLRLRQKKNHEEKKMKPAQGKKQRIIQDRFETPRLSSRWAFGIRILCSLMLLTVGTTASW